MKQRNGSSIDGFVPRQPRPDLSRQFDANQVYRRHIEKAPVLPEPDRRTTYTNDISASLDSIDKQEDTATPPRLAPTKKRRFVFFKRHRKSDSAKPYRKKLIKRILLVIALLAVLIGGYFGVRILIASSRLLHGNLLSLIQPGTPLKTDGEGRTNILVFGTSQDDAAHQNAVGGGGLWLTDSIMLISMNQKDHTIKTVSIPRDLWVNMPNACMVGYQNKINAVYECGSGLVGSGADEQKKSDYKSKDKAGAHALESTIHDVTGITPQYYVHVNYTVLKQSVDAVGGVDVHIVGDGADGIYDTNFDWDCPHGPYTCKNVYYPHDGTYHLNGKQALFLARARADGGRFSYKDFGLAQGDFDRQQNQQKIMTALRHKATSAGTLTNPVKLTDLLSALGDNITTDLEGGNYKTLIEYSKKMPAKNAMTSIDLVKPGESVVQNQSVDGASAVVATSGLLNYDSIINYLAKKLSTNPAVAEGATIAIYNASGTPGVASTLETTLSEQGLDVTGTGNAASSDAAGNHYTIYDQSGGKKNGTIKYLKFKYGMVHARGSVPSDISVDADLVIVVGQNSSGTPGE